MLWTWTQKENLGWLLENKVCSLKINLKFKSCTDYSETDLHMLCENHLKKSTTAVAFLLSKEESVVVEECSTETVVFSGQQRVTQVWK